MIVFVDFESKSHFDFDKVAVEVYGMINYTGKWIFGIRKSNDLISI